MQIRGMGAAVQGPQLPCCENAAAVEASALVGGTGPACDPNCIGNDNSQAVLERMQAAIDALTQQAERAKAPGDSWFPGLSNTAVLAVGLGIGAILLFRGHR